MNKNINDILLNSGTKDRQDYLEEKSKDDGEYPCNLCGKSFKDKKTYDAHKNGKNSDKSYYCKAMREDTEIEEMEDEEEVDNGEEEMGDEGDEGGKKKKKKKKEGGDEVSKLKDEIKELKAEIKELKGGKKKSKKKGDDKDYDGDGESDDDEMAKLRAMRK